MYLYRMLVLVLDFYMYISTCEKPSAFSFFLLGLTNSPAFCSTYVSGYFLQERVYNEILYFPVI